MTGVKQCVGLSRQKDPRKMARQSGRKSGRKFLAAVLTVASLPAASAFAAWFVDRSVSCFTELAESEIIMNNQVLPPSSSRDPGIHVEVSPVGAKDGSEFLVKFVLPGETTLSDVQYVLEISGGPSETQEEPLDAPAKFTSPPQNGGIGCEGRRSHGRAGPDDSAAVLTINDDAARGATLEIWAGWATGHEPVTLTDKLVVVVGEGIVAQPPQPSNDDATDTDDEHQLQLEHQAIEQERKTLEEELDSVEVDAVKALEEKRSEAEELGPEIEEAEEQVVEALESQRKQINHALNELKDEIIIRQVETQQDQVRNMKPPHERREQKRKEFERRHKQKKDMHLEEMRRHFAKADDPRKQKLEQFMGVKDSLQDSVKKIQTMDHKEHERAKEAHLPEPRNAGAEVEQLKKRLEEMRKKTKRERNSFREEASDMDRIKQQQQQQKSLTAVHEKIQQTAQSLKNRMGVNEMIQQRDMKVMDKLRGGIGKVRGTEEGGIPLSPLGKHCLLGLLLAFLGVGVIRWGLERQRRSRKGRRNL